MAVASRPAKRIQMPGASGHHGIVTGMTMSRRLARSAGSPVMVKPLHERNGATLRPSNSRSCSMGSRSALIGSTGIERLRENPSIRLRRSWKACAKLRLSPDESVSISICPSASATTAGPICGRPASSGS